MEIAGYGIGMGIIIICYSDRCNNYITMAVWLIPHSCVTAYVAQIPFCFHKGLFQNLCFSNKSPEPGCEKPFADKTLSYNSKRNIIEDVFHSVSIIFVHKISQWGPKRYWSLLYAKLKKTDKTENRTGLSVMPWRLINYNFWFNYPFKGFVAIDWRSLSFNLAHKKPECSRRISRKRGYQLSSPSAACSHPASLPPNIQGDDYSLIRPTRVLCSGESPEGESVEACRLE